MRRAITLVVLFGGVLVPVISLAIWPLPAWSVVSSLLLGVAIGVSDRVWRRGALAEGVRTMAVLFGVDFLYRVMLAPAHREVVLIAQLVGLVVAGRLVTILVTWARLSGRAAHS